MEGRGGEGRIVNKNQFASWHGLRAFAVASGVGVLVPLLALRGFPTTAPEITVAIASVGMAVTLSQLGASGRVLSALAGAISAGIGIITIAEYAFGPNGVIERLLVPGASSQDPVPSDRPLPLASAMLLVLGMALLFPQSRGWRRVKALCALIVLSLAWTFLNGYWLGGIGPGAVMSPGSVTLPAAAALLLSALGMLASQPGTWPTVTVFSSGLAGVVCRRLLPSAALAPPLLGWCLSDPGALLAPPVAFSWSLYALLSSVGGVALVLALARRIERLDSERAAATLLSLHDPLTGLPNRRAFDAFLLEAFNLARRRLRPLSLLTVDVDNFKSYNDAYGQAAGDELLKLVGMTFTGLARDTDLVARIGGEEFALVLPDTDSAAAYRVAERARAEIAALELFPRLVTVSIGVATLSSRTSTALGLFKESDLALYSAKQSGRGCVATEARVVTN
jgi:diguanylate cyclase (GGDEF)-like protein